MAVFVYFLSSVHYLQQPHSYPLFGWYTTHKRIKVEAVTSSDASSKLVCKPYAPYIMRYAANTYGNKM